jgi:protein-tyrosine phosphatase
MIDLHCHILPGIDDGAENAKESVRMAKVAADDGITHIVATPHVRETLHPPAFLKKYVTKFNEALQKLHVPVEILYGADVYAMLPPKEVLRYAINNTQYILIEFPYTHIPANAADIIFNFKLQGLIPIITHPERNPSVIRDPEKLFSLLARNVYVQITGDSLTGNFGHQIQECAFYLLKKGAVHFIASDAHSEIVRGPVLSEAAKVAEKIVGKENARMLVNDNPLAVILGKDIPLASFYK